MIKTQKPLLTVRKIALAAVTVFALAQCSQEEEIVPVVTETPVENNATPTELPTDASLTISGIHTYQTDSTDCSTCTYVVPADTHLVDGEKLSIKPGSVICLDKAIAYGMLEFVNLEGTEDSPITIAYCNK